MKILILACLFWFYAASSWASATGEVNTANHLFKKGQYDKAVDYYTDALKKKNSALIEYNLGTALYKSGDYPHAVEHLRNAAGSKDAGLKTAPHYNLGNALYKLGKSSEKTNIDQAVQNVEDSLANFKSVLDIDSKDKDAKFNYDLVKKELERLKKEQKKQKQQNKKSQGGQNKKDDKKSAEDKSAQGQNKGDQSKDTQQKDQQNKDQQKQGDQKDARDKQEQEKADRQKSDAKKDGHAQGETQGMTTQEAKDALEDYQRNQEPKGLLNFIPKTKSDEPVAKDW